MSSPAATLGWLTELLDRLGIAHIFAAYAIGLAAAVLWESRCAIAAARSQVTA